MSWTTTTRFPFLPITRSQPSGQEGASADVEEFADTSDEKLLAFVQAGNRDALGVLFRRFARLVRSVSVRILRDEGEAEDLVQELFLFIYRGTASYDDAKSSARSWIVQMTYRRAISRWRYLNARGHYRNAELDCCHSAPESVVALTYDSSIEALLGRDGLKKVMEELTAEQHETLRLHFYEGYTLAEIGKKLGQSPGNVRHHYYRGLEKLRKQVRESKLQNC
jgi:RNA polymerase sigma-70 factor (ECF subfamily)